MYTQKLVLLCTVVTCIQHIAYSTPFSDALNACKYAHDTIACLNTTVHNAAQDLKEKRKSMNENDTLKATEAFYNDYQSMQQLYGTQVFNRLAAAYPATTQLAYDVCAPLRAHKQALLSHHKK